MSKNTGVYTHRFFFFLCMVAGCLLWSSCFDLVEEIDMNHQGAGTIKATLNLSKSRTQVASLLKMKRVNGSDIASERKMNQEIEQTVRTLKSTPGVSHVQYNLDVRNHIASLPCHFDDVQALNE